MQELLAALSRQGRGAVFKPPDAGRIGQACPAHSPDFQTIEALISPLASANGRLDGCDIKTTIPWRKPTVATGSRKNAA